ncbi:MAG TPA: hypothetical protein VHB70_14795 [Parafilimonas sp.]|nr:hypothetical protein [Parafilimonas sp.]
MSLCVVLCLYFVHRLTKRTMGFNDTIPGIRSTHHPLAGTILDSKNFYLQ